jgi:hypothetical protein
LQALHWPLFLADVAKNSDNPSNTTLIANTWKIDKVMLDGMEMTTAEIALDEGGADITNTFTKEGNFSYLFTDKMGVAQSGIGKWEFVNNSFGLRIFGVNGVEPETSTIIKITSNELWYWHMDGSMKMEMHWKTN